MFTDQDLLQFQRRGILLDAIIKQIQYFSDGFPYTKIKEAATVDNGILVFTETTQAQYVSIYEKKAVFKLVYKFIPASGAASRMFKALFEFMDAAKSANQSELIEHPKHKAIKQFIEKIDLFAFKELLEQQLPDGLDSLIAQHQYATILSALLEEEGLNYGNLPKGLLQFHRYPNGTRTPAEEHLVEAAHYGKSTDGKAYLHFTVSPEHQARFEALIQEKQNAYEALLKVQFDISFSQQYLYTDTIAVDMDNNPFRLDDDTILFRPGGHGALIENLNDLDADLVFIKNIDNVVPDTIKSTTHHFKKVIGGVLLNAQEHIFEHLECLEGNYTEDEFIEAEQYVNFTLCTKFPASYYQLPLIEKVQFLRTKLNRPIRVCGMVKNEGEPGGGPFWTENTDGTVSLQIVESAQLDPNDAAQMNLLQTSSHFNPVDIVCSMKNHKGEKFNLLEYVNPLQGFIAEKSLGGRNLKALELPGLWNGSMSDWNTIFVEVPLLTFNPVKQVNDLLRPNHQEK